MTKRELTGFLEALDNKADKEWALKLDKRKLDELRFHNEYRDGREDSYGNKKFYKSAQLSKNYIEDWILRNSPGKIFLDYACGNGDNAVLAAKHGAELAIGIDLSDISIRNARQLAEKQGVSKNTFFIQGDCENTSLPDECVDVCICSGMLHHLNLDRAFHELSRILNKNGVILAVEALDYNPIIKLYRYMTPRLRTEWEKSHILSYKDIRLAKKYFDVKDIRHWHLFSIIGTFISPAAAALDSIDAVVLKIPVIKLMSWMFTFELHKKGQ